MNYFSILPTKNYDIGKDKGLRTVADLGRRVGIRSNMEDVLTAYYKTSLTTSDRPENVADNIYGDSRYHWILMQLNNVVDPYYDWVLEPDTFDSFVAKKYPNYNLLLYTDHHAEPSYNVGVPKKYFFYPGETISGGSATGTVVEFNPTIKQVVYKPVSGTFAKDDSILGSVSGAMGKVEVYSTEAAGIHHYESTSPDEVGLHVHRDYEVVYGVRYYYAKSVDNQTHELNLNEEKREISVLRGDYLQQYVNEFKEKVKQ